VIRYLLDTNITSDLIRNPSGLVAKRISEIGETAVCTSIIVAAELRYGLSKRGSARLLRQVEAVLGVLKILPLEAPADIVYGRLRADLERIGRPIGNHDLLIAAHAMPLGHCVVTDNLREFARIEGLATENWLR